MLAVISTGGKQYIVKKDDCIKIEKLETEEGKKVVFNDVLLTSNEDGENIEIGAPTVANAVVEAEVVKHDRHDKVMSEKHKAKKRYHVRRGHRQWYTEVKITNISAKTK